MAEFTLIIGNKNYSSWSLRPWLALKRAGLPFDEVLIALDQPNTRSEIFRWSPSGRVPCLVHGDVSVWESLAIMEYLAEIAPEAGLWPEDRGARALARAVSTEMHAGFSALRQALPMNIRSSFPGRPIPVPVQEDINRVAAIWRDCRKRFGESAGGPFLFGGFTIADAMYAPVVTRFTTYGVPLDEDARSYVATMTALPEMRAWADAARREPMVIPSAEF